MTDLTQEEQEHVRMALRYLRVQHGGLRPLAKVLHADIKVLRAAINGDRQVTASLTFRAARLAGVAIEDLLDGTYPPEGVCPHCGQRLPETARLLEIA